jgi:hypothetical protein
MKIYIAAPEPNDLKIASYILLSYYYITKSPIPFKKETWRLILEKGGILNEKQKDTGCTGGPRL